MNEEICVLACSVIDVSLIPPIYAFELTSVQKYFYNDILVRGHFYIHVQVSYLNVFEIAFKRNVKSLEIL